MTERPWGESVMPTPEQFVDWFTRSPRPEQVRIADGLLTNVLRAHRCFEQNHDSLQQEVNWFRRQRLSTWSAEPDPYYVFGIPIHVSEYLPIKPSPGTVARRMVRHGFADVLAWLGEDVGPEPLAETHAILIAEPALMVSETLALRLRRGDGAARRVAAVAIAGGKL